MNPFTLDDLPLLNAVAKQIQFEGSENVFLFGIQHLSFTTALMFESLIKCGMDPSHIFLLGKCYSSNPQAVAIIEELGISISTLSFCFNSHIPFDIQFSSYVKEFFLPHFRKNKDMGRWIILDDGGELIKLISKYQFNDQVVAIEQTSAGYHIAKTLNLSFPLINVARANIKMNYESQFIAQTICSKICEEIELHFSTPKQVKVLVIGGGPIGKKIYEKLSKYYDIKLFDVIENKSDFSKDQFDDYIPHFDVIIGSTGNCSLGIEKHHLVKNNALLISASSSDRELDSCEIRKKHPVYHSCHAKIQGDQFTLLNSGFPINFDKEFTDSPDFQLTRALLLTAIDQAIDAFDLDHVGILELKNQDLLLASYLKIKQKEAFKN